MPFFSTQLLIKACCNRNIGYVRFKTIFNAAQSKKKKNKTQKRSSHCLCQ